MFVSVVMLLKSSVLDILVLRLSQEAKSHLLQCAMCVFAILAVMQMPVKASGHFCISNFQSFPNSTTAEFLTTQISVLGRMAITIIIEYTDQTDAVDMNMRHQHH